MRILLAEDNLINQKIAVGVLEECGHTVEVDDPSRTVTIKFHVQPEAQFPWHTHPGPVVVNVKRGSLTETFFPARALSVTACASSLVKSKPAPASPSRSCRATTRP